MMAMDPEKGVDPLQTDFDLEPSQGWSVTVGAVDDEGTRASLL